jgi:hypothetical protein
MNLIRKIGNVTYQDVFLKWIKTQNQNERLSTVEKNKDEKIVIDERKETSSIVEKSCGNKYNIDIDKIKENNFMIKLELMPISTLCEYYKYRDIENELKNKKNLSRYFLRSRNAIKHNDDDEEKSKCDIMQTTTTRSRNDKHKRQKKCNDEVFTDFSSFDNIFFTDEDDNFSSNSKRKRKKKNSRF